jgi:hypothetical protein
MAAISSTEQLDPRDPNFFSGPSVTTIGKLKVRTSNHLGLRYVHLQYENTKDNTIPPSRVTFPATSLGEIIPHISLVLSEIENTPANLIIPTLTRSSFGLVNRGKPGFWDDSACRTFSNIKIRFEKRNRVYCMCIQRVDNNNSIGLNEDETKRLLRVFQEIHITSGIY